MWFKRTYFEPSTKVPLVVRGPGVSPRRVSETVSLVDLYPTLLEMAELDDWRSVQETVDGDSLGGLMRGERDGWKNYALSEYYSEGVCQPMRMAVRDELKYVYVHEEQPQLFDLRRDPKELENRVGDPDYGERLGDLERLVHDGWDGGRMRARVIESQGRRRAVNEAMAQGAAACWDVRPQIDAREQYVRRLDAQETSRQRRM